MSNRLSHADHARRWLVEPGSEVHLDRIDTSSKDGAPGNKELTLATCEELVAKLGEWQTKLWAEGKQSLLVVLQAMDAGGKDGTIRKVLTGVNPQGVKVASFKAPTSRGTLRTTSCGASTPHAPAQGEIGIFNRSHYEDVLVVRVNQIVPEAVWRPRYEIIRTSRRC